MAAGSLDVLESCLRLDEPTEIEEMDVEEPLPTDLPEVEVRVEDPDEIAMLPLFKAESLEDFRVVDSAVGTMSISLLTGPRSETGAGELGELDRGEDERVGVAASVFLREK